MKSKSYIVLASSIMLLFCMTYSATYSYYTASIKDEREGVGTAGLTAADLEDLTIISKNSVNNGLWIPGDSAEYSFTITNPSSVPMCVTLYWSSVTNGWTNKENLVYKLEKTDGEETSTIVKEEGQFPDTSTTSTLTDTNTIGTVTVGNGATNTYTLTVTYQDTDEPQNEDMDANFSGSISGALTTCSTDKG